MSKPPLRIFTITLLGKTDHLAVSNLNSGQMKAFFKQPFSVISNKEVREYAMENEVNPDESVDKDTVEDSNLIKVVDEPVLSDTQYNARKRKCGKCANSSNPSACISCSDYSKFEPSRYR